MDWLGHLQPQIYIKPTLMLIFALCFTWRLTYAILNLFRRSQMDLMWVICFFFFFGHNRKHLPVCAKTISSWVRKVLGITKAHMSPSTLHGAVMSAALAADISLVSMLQAGDWVRVSTTARHYFSTNITTMDQHQDSLELLFWVSESSQPCWLVSNIDL